MAVRPTLTPVSDVNVPVICQPLPAPFRLAPQAEASVCAGHWSEEPRYELPVCVDLQRTLQPVRDLHAHKEPVSAMCKLELGLYIKLQH
jgi:hypothetical protein